MTAVHDPSTGKTHHYSLPAREALIAAHAQTAHGDYHTWDYATRYADLEITRDGDALVCGTLRAEEER